MRADASLRLALLVAVLWGSRSAAQRVPENGALIRWRFRDSSWVDEGHFVALEASVLKVSVRGERQLSLDRSRLVSVRAFQRTRTTGTVLGLVSGLGVGVLVGTVAAVNSGAARSCIGECHVTGMGLLQLTGGVTGAVSGAIIGRLLPIGRWREFAGIALAR